MVAERRDVGGGRSDKGEESAGDEESAGGEKSAGNEEIDGGSGPESDDQNQHVHVRRLDVIDTLRWSWEVLTHRRGLLGLAFAVNLLSVVATVGVSRPSPSAEPEFADWVLWLYLVQLLGFLVAGGVFYLTAADEVANRSRTFTSHLIAAIKRLPSLVVTTAVVAVLVGLSLLPVVAVVAAEWPSVVSLPITLLLTLFSVYVFHRLLLAYPACVIDGKGPVASPRASWRAATGIVYKVFAVGIIYVLAALASNVVSGLVGGQYDVASTLVSAGFGAVIFPFFGLARAHLYLEGSRNR
jgi:hypothetical protein